MAVSNVGNVPMLLTRFDPALAVGLVAIDTYGFDAATMVISSNAPGQLMWHRNVSDVLQNVLRA